MNPQDLLQVTSKFEILAMKIHRNKRNGYIDFKAGGWGVTIYGAKEPPQHGDRVWIDLSYLDNPLADPNVEEIVDQVTGENTNLKGQIVYTCSIQSQERVEHVMAATR